MVWNEICVEKTEIKPAIQGIIYISGTLHKSAVSDVQGGSGREGVGREG